MTDTYLDMVNSGLGKQVAGKLGLPRPVTLRRYRADDDFPQGAVLVLGRGKQPFPSQSLQCLIFSHCARVPSRRAMRACATSAAL